VTFEDHFSTVVILRAQLTRDLLAIAKFVSFYWELYVMPGKIVSFQPVVHYNHIYLILIGLVAFFIQVQLLHVLRYHKTISILGATLCRAMRDLLSFGVIMGIVFFAFTSAIYLMYHDLDEYSTMITAMGSQVMVAVLIRTGVATLYSADAGGAIDRSFCLSFCEQDN